MPPYENKMKIKCAYLTEIKETFDSMTQLIIV